MRQPKARFRIAVLACFVALLAACAQVDAVPPEGPDEPAPAEPAPPESPPIAVQMYTLRDYGSIDAQLRLAADEGFEAVEPIGSHGSSPGELRSLLDQHGLEVTSVHTDLDALRGDLDGVAALARALGTEVVVLPELPPEARPQTAEGWRDVGVELDGYGSRLRAEGLVFAYHNHDHEMAVLDGELALDHMLGAADPENLAWQADVGWIVRAGQDPVPLLSRHAGRVISIHAKDVAPAGENGDEEGFADVGYGVVDWDAVLPAARDAGAEWYVVEHDAPADHARTLSRSWAFLNDRLSGLLDEAP